MTCCYEKPVWKTCDLAGKDKVFDLSYDVLIFAVCPYPSLNWYFPFALASHEAHARHDLPQPVRVIIGHEHILGQYRRCTSYSCTALSVHT